MFGFAVVVVCFVFKIKYVASKADVPGEALLSFHTSMYTQNTLEPLCCVYKKLETHRRSRHLFNPFKYQSGLTLLSF